MAKPTTLRALSKSIQQAESQLRKFRPAASPADKKKIDLHIQKLSKFEQGVKNLLAVHIPHSAKLQWIPWVPHIPPVLKKKMKPHVGKMKPGRK